MTKEQILLSNPSYQYISHMILALLVFGLPFEVYLWIISLFICLYCDLVLSHRLRIEFI